MSIIASKESMIQDLRGHVDVNSSKVFADLADAKRKLEECTKEIEEHKNKRNLAKQEMMAVAKVFIHPRDVHEMLLRVYHLLHISCRLLRSLRQIVFICVIYWVSHP